MDINVVISGFIGSFPGVASGFIVAVYLDWQHTRRGRRTHILALIREILSNNVRVQLLLKEKRREEVIEDQAWRELRVQLAGDLWMDLYSRLASHYDEFTETRHIYQELSNAGTWPDDAENVGRPDV